VERYVQRPTGPGPFTWLFADLGHYQPTELGQRSVQLARTFRDRESGSPTAARSGRSRSTSFRDSSAHSNETCSRGIAQRVRALEAILADVDGEGRTFDEGLFRRSVVT
jgi:uncharacterized circularly permuted ATP-grasp superfamily protein